MTVSELRNKFQQQLTSIYSTRESELIIKQLLCTRLNFTSGDWLLNLNTELDFQAIDLLELDLQRLLKEEPLQYVLGETVFCDLLLKCSPAALIPRPETEELVSWILQENENLPMSVMDIGTGTGCIPLSLKNKRPNWEVQGVDISPDALELAKTNASTLNLDVAFHYMDILSSENSFANEMKFDIIVSNPPYIPFDEQDLMNRNVVNHEPSLALFVPNDDPLVFYRAIASFAEKSLNPQGRVYFEVHELFANEVTTLLHEAGFSNIQLRKDLQGKLRMICSQRVSL